MKNILQSLVLPKLDFPTELYLNLRANDRWTSFPTYKIKNEIIRLASDEAFSTNTYFNSFYRSYWNEYTSVEDLSCRITFKGCILVRAFEDTSGGRKCLLEEKLEAKNKTTKSLPLFIKDSALFPPTSAGSRIFVDVEAIEESEVHGLEYTTTEQPGRSISLTIGLCTFNREVELSKTLEQINSNPKLAKAINKILIVNQGPAFSNAKCLKAIENNKKIECIEQKNLGGCGGFTRSMFEAIKTAEDGSYHLLMDDDIVLDERIIEKAIRFAEYTNDMQAIGGSMLDMAKPTVMYEAGAFISKDGILQPFGHNQNLADMRKLSDYNSVVKTDFNAWWFFMVPTAKIIENNLPAPIFLRGDDFEYGYRLKQNGTNTITMPGVSVWHEPFYLKAPGWQDYYDFRNRLIFIATHLPQQATQQTLNITDVIFSKLMTHKYDCASLCIRALEDYNKGPKVLFSQDASELHSEIVEILKLYRNAPPNIDPNTLPLQNVKPCSNGTLAVASRYFLRGLMTPLGYHSKKPKLFMYPDSHAANVGNHSYFATNHERSYHLFYEPSRANFLTLFKRAMKALYFYSKNKESIAKQWENGISDYREVQFWQNIYD